MTAKKDTYTQKKLAALLGIGEPTMSRWLTGKIKLGQIELLLRFMEQLPEEHWQREIASALTLRAGNRYRKRHDEILKKRRRVPKQS